MPSVSRTKENLLIAALLALVLLWVTDLPAQETASVSLKDRNAVFSHEAQADSSIDEIFNSSLAETTDIATKTRLNVDDVPAFVSILYQDDLLKLGIVDVYEALCLVPGVEPYMEATGARQLLFRGVKEKSKVKLLLDGIDINNTFRGSIYYYYDFPIELIQRIEVIRGPGAVLYGSGAMSGVINIVTKSSDPMSGSRIFGSAASYDTYRGGGIFSYGSGDLHLAVDGYYTQTNKGIKAGPDRGGNYGRSNEAGNDCSVGIVAQNSSFKFTTRLKRSKNGVAFGRFHYFDPDDSNDGLINSTLLSELQYSTDISKDITIKAKGGYSFYREELESLGKPMPGGGLKFNVDYTEDRLYADLGIILSGISGHHAEGGIRFEHSQAHKDKFRAFMTISPRYLLMPEHVIKPKVSRQIGTFYFNDQYHLNERVDLSLGFRYDIYSDIDNAANPRVGIIYRWSDALNLKAMYSRAFRVPSWVELYQNVPRAFEKKPDFSNEKSDTIEFGFLFNNSQNRLSFNLYWTQINDLILYDASKVQYTQHGRNQFLGGELTWKYHLFENTDLDASLSYVYPTDGDGEKLPNVANWLGNLIVMHTFDIGLTSATHLRFASDRLREEGDPRDNLNGYVVVDELFTYRFRQASLTAGVKNIFDENVRYPAPPRSYENDFPREGRTWIVELSLDF